MKSNKAFKIDHEESLAAIFKVARNATVSRANTLSFLYGARVALVNGGLPEECIRELDAEIAFYERNVDLESGKVRANVEKEATYSGS